MKTLCILSICLTGLLLLLYPFILMANVMSLAAVPSSTDPPASVALASSFFLWGSTLYPLPYLAALILSLWNIRKNIKRSLTAQAILWFYLSLVGLSFVFWIFLD